MAEPGTNTRRVSLITQTQAVEVLWRVHIEPGWPQLDCEAAPLDGAFRIFPCTGAGPAHFMEHSGRCPSATDRIESAILRGTDCHIGIGRQQRADMIWRQPGGIAAQHQGLSASA